MNKNKHCLSQMICYFAVILQTLLCTAYLKINVWLTCYIMFFVDSKDCPDELALTTSVPEQSEIDHSLDLVVSKSSVYESD